MTPRICYQLYGGFWGLLCHNVEPSAKRREQPFRLGDLSCGPYLQAPLRVLRQDRNLVRGRVLLTSPTARMRPVEKWSLVAERPVAAAHADIEGLQGQLVGDPNDHECLPL